jgi:hydrogenase expression/formation protein HypD
MKYVDEYRDETTAQRYVEAIQRTVTRPWTLMEICGGQTHTILKFGLDRMLPEEVTLVHGPGCPVCVTPVELLDKAIAIASRPGVTFTSFGDMLRVPGSHKDLLMVKAEGGDVRMVYSPLDALKLAQQDPGREVVFFAVGFETTAPANAMAVWQAQQMGLPNFSVLSAHVLVPPAIEAILSAPGNEVQGFLAPGHVCTVMGYWEYEHQYARSVRREGNTQAQQIIRQVFEVTDRAWRGIGVIPRSGLRLQEEYAECDAERRFDVAEMAVEESPECIAGLILQGRKKPPECTAFGTRCTPEHPLGAPMVSSEGACAAYHRYSREA